MKDEYYVRIQGKTTIGEAWTDNYAEITGERHRRLGAEACQAATGRARRHTCIVVLWTYTTASDTALREATSNTTSSSTRYMHALR